MKYYAALCEVWVKPLFKRARPKNITSTWAAHDLNQFYELVREHYAGKRYKLLHFDELETKAPPAAPGSSDTTGSDAARKEEI
jgi:hypothetical protein